MALNDLKNQNIQDTFQKIVQTDGTNLADGTGSLLPISFNGNNVIISGSLTANEYIISSSVTNITIEHCQVQLSLVILLMIHTNLREV